MKHGDFKYTGLLSAYIICKESFERREIVSLNNHIFCVRIAITESVIGFQKTIWYCLCGCYCIRLPFP